MASKPPLHTARAARAANLLRRAAISASERRHTAAGRRWLRSYLNGCAFKIFDAPLPGHLAGLPFTSACEWLYRTTGCVLIGARLTRRLRGPASLARRSSRLATVMAVCAGRRAHVSPRRVPVRSSGHALLCGRVLEKPADAHPTPPVSKAALGS